MENSGRRISVLHLIHTVAYGGVESAVLNWVRATDPRHFDVRVACFENPGHTEAPFVEAASSAGLEVDKIPWGRRKPILRASGALVRLLRQHRVDILHLHNAYADFVGVFAGMRTSVRTVTTIYVWDKFEWKRNFIQALDRLAIRHLDLITAHCDETFQKTVAFGFPPERMKTLTTGHDTPLPEMPAEERSRLRWEMGVGEGQIIIVNVARLYPEKRHDLLLRCFKQVFEAYPQTRLWIAGVGPSEAELRRYVKELGLQDAITFLGFVKDLPRLYPLADIQIDPAMAAGIPLGVCSGMAAGLPVVAANVGGLKEVLKNGQTGYLVPADDEVAYVRTISMLIEDPQQRKRIGDAARELIRNDYSLEKAVRRLEDTYFELVGLKTANERRCSPSLGAASEALSKPSE